MNYDYMMIVLGVLAIINCVVLMYDVLTVED